MYLSNNFCAKAHWRTNLFTKSVCDIKCEKTNCYNANKNYFTLDFGLKELGDKVEANDRAKIEEEVGNVKKALEGNNTEEINKATEKLMTSFYDVSTKLYQQAGAQAQPGAETQTATDDTTTNDDNVVDADYQVVDDEENK